MSTMSDDGGLSQPDQAGGGGPPSAIAAHALARRLVPVLRRENEEMATIQQLLRDRRELEQDVHRLMDGGKMPTSRAECASLSQSIEDEINQLQILKASLVRRRELRRDVNRLREGGRGGDVPSLPGPTEAPDGRKFCGADGQKQPSSKSGDGTAQCSDHVMRENDNGRGEGTLGRKSDATAPTHGRAEANEKKSSDSTTQKAGDNESHKNCFSEGGNDELEDSEDDDEQQENEATDEEIARAMQSLEQGRDAVLYDKSSFEICCYMCRCKGGEGCDRCQDINPKQVKEVLPSLSPRTSSVYYARVHRICCASIRKFTDMQREYAVTNYGIAVTTPPAKKKRFAFKLPPGFLKDAKELADRLHTKVLNDLSCKAPVQTLFTDPRYTEYILPQFRAAKCRAESEGRKAANVLSLFSGIGSGILALKKLGIAINKCVVVERDPIAEAVCAANHKDDVTSYIWIRTFEELESQLDDIMAKNGPIHVIEGGPPCVEYSAINANRAGIDSVKGQYMLKFAELVQRIRNHTLQKGEYLVFLCENVSVKWEEGMSKFDSAFGISPAVIDAQHLSPAKRERAYYTNIPVNGLPGPDSDASLSSVDLRDGWMDPAQLYCAIRGMPKPYSKANTFMASDGRIDDHRMIKVRLKDFSDKNSIETSTYSVGDREALMGFPRGYVESIVEPIFERLSESFHSEDWVENVFQNGWDYDKLIRLSSHHYKFVCDAKDPKLLVKFGTVEKNKKGKTLYYYDCEGYCKRLLGNCYSIPAVEHLLRPLQDIFAKREGTNTAYRFEWE